MMSCWPGNPLLQATIDFTRNVLSGLSESRDHYLSSRQKSKYKEGLIRYLSRCYSRNELLRWGGLTASSKRLEEVAEGLSGAGYYVLSADFVTEGRLLVGMSEGLLKQALEVGAVFDPVLALPYIPGSSIKGLMRSYLINELKNNEGCLRKVGELFGNEPGSRIAWKGRVFVADAYPVGLRGDYMLLPDIITPHYYKRGKPVETELDAEPVPVPHLSVAEGVVFRFVIGLEEGAQELITEIGECLEKALGTETKISGTWVTSLLGILAAALAIAGIGGRTTKGYGSMGLTNISSIKALSPGGR